MVIFDYTYCANLAVRQLILLLVKQRFPALRLRTEHSYKRIVGSSCTLSLAEHLSYTLADHSRTFILRFQ